MPQSPQGPDTSRLGELVSLLYEDLHRIAARHLRRERREHTLQTTALLHEAYLKLSDDSRAQFADKTHFLAVASRVMRQVLVDYARARGTKKRGAGLNPLPPEEAMAWQVAPEQGGDPLEILELSRALDALAREDESLAQLVEMRYFGGMTAEETAGALGRSAHTVRHDLRLAQAWLRRELRK